MADAKQTVDKALANFQKSVPDLVKNNKGALIGAALGYLLTDNKQAQSTILGAIAGAFFVDQNNDKKETKNGN